MKKKGRFRNPADQVVGLFPIDRKRAGKLYFSGEIDALRETNIQFGDTRWRIARYRRVVDPAKLGYPISKYHYVLPESFDNHLRYLIKHCRVLPLDTLVQMLNEKREIPDKTVALTFDGGWIDNFVYAYPLLVKYQLPATFFLPTAFVGTMNYFWQDKILFALVILMGAGTHFHTFDFFTAEQVELVDSVSPTGEITLPLIFVIISILSMHPFEDRFLALKVLGGAAQNVGGDLPVEPAFMSWDDARMMEVGGMSFGSLGHSQAAFSELTPENMKKDIRTSGESLNHNLKNISSVFAFPEGIIPESALPVLQDERIEFAAGMMNILPPRSVDTKPVLMPRVPIYEGQADCTELFACRLWLYDMLAVPEQ